MVVQPPPPAGRRSKATCTGSPSALAPRVIVPLTFGAGAPSVTEGAKLSTVMLTVPVVVELPATSLITAEIVAPPSPPDAEFQLIWNGALPAVPIEPPFTKYSTPAIGLSSEAETPSVMLPDTVDPESGEATLPVGAVLSTIFDGRSVVFVFPASSSTMKRRSHEPSSPGDVAQVALYGSVVSTPSDVHVLSLERLCWNSTCVTSAPPGPPVSGSAVRVTVPRRKLPGSFAPGSGGVESIITVAVFGDSMFPATSVEETAIVR